jgi:hypothetical protein
LTPKTNKKSISLGYFSEGRSKVLKAVPPTQLFNDPN